MLTDTDIITLMGTDGAFADYREMLSSLLSTEDSAMLLAMVGQTFNQDAFEYMVNVVPPRGRLAEDDTVDSETEGASLGVDTQTEYVRPNGEVYYPRDWTGVQDVAVLKKARQSGLFPLLYGPPGTGKTALAEAAFGEEMLTIVMTGDTEVSDLIGSYVPGAKPGSFHWIDGPLLTAAKEGRPILLDEVGLGDPKVLSVVYGLMDDRREVVVTANPEIGTIKAQDGFFVLGATNPHAPGVRLSEALLSRFLLHVEVRTDWALVGKLGVPHRMVTFAQNLARRVDDGTLTWAPQFRECIAYRDIAETFGSKFALANLLAQAPEIDQAEVLQLAERAFGTEINPARI